MHRALGSNTCRASFFGGITMPELGIPPSLADASGQVSLNGALLSMLRVPAPHGQEHKTIAVRLADCDGLRSQANVLINRMYGWRGYGSDHEIAGGEHCVTFTASSENEVIGTLTLTVDTPAGLSTDHTFKRELDRYRKMPGARLCELTKFAVDPATKSPPALAALFHVIFIYGMQRFDCTDLFIEVHPRHIRFYEAMLGFKRVGPPKIDDSVTWWPSDTPVQLMRLKVSAIRRQIDRHAGRTLRDGRSLYPYFFSPEEERGIALRVACLGGGEAKEVGLAPKTSVNQPRCSLAA
jgi:hypothetical protein